MPKNRPYPMPRPARQAPPSKKARLGLTPGAPSSRKDKALAKIRLGQAGRPRRPSPSLPTVPRKKR